MSKRRVRLLAAVLGIAIIAAAGSCHVPPNAETRSYYMARNTSADAAALGCFQADKTGRMSLFFGAPTVVNGAYGATAWGAPNLGMAQIEAVIRDFIRGYAYCRTNGGFRLQVGVGTSNSGIEGRGATWLRGHGQAWATSVRNLAGWANRYYPGIAQVYAAWDFEPSWSSFTSAEYWMHGYDSVSGRQLLFANSSADGCPQTTATNGACNNGWNQHRVWHLAWEHDPSLPIPQIYTNSGSQARQWQKIDLWSTVYRGDGMYFYGTLTQYGACRQVGGCSGTSNTPHVGHDQLRYVLASDRRTDQPSIQTITDMNWNS